ncbi:MAG TPA: potassium transporter Kup [Methylomirabilota bacterium]|nr:potassium transporter Kup [Methylomirabilota bacterium]
MSNDTSRSPVRAKLVLGALGIVYGDIGTSPLYAFRECFHGDHALRATPENILGVLSLISWSLILIVAVKYLALILRADNRGEGGILALLSLAFPEKGMRQGSRWRSWPVYFGIFGACLLYGDGMITPPITILGAMEGLTVAAPHMEQYIVPVTVLILIALFSMQFTGTARIGSIFGPVMLVWFSSIAILGIRGLLTAPGALAALNPFNGILFLIHHQEAALYVLGSVVLVVTGAEALYADMGHFGRRPIQRAWFLFVFPALLLNYFGQAALVLSDPSAASNPFYKLVPAWGLYPMIALAAMAACIASQALISGAFSLTMQAVQLGYLPRVRIEHTSSTERGQIYIPLLNWFLFFACLALVLGFRTSSNLAATYGVAVTLTMLITTVLFYFAAQNVWGWSRRTAALVSLPFLIVELAYCSSNVLKLSRGGWFTIAVAACIFTVMVTWRKGRKILAAKFQHAALPLDLFLQSIKADPPMRVAGTAVFLSGRLEGAPLALLHNLKHNKVLHQRVIILTIQTQEQPHVPMNERATVEALEDGFYRVVGRYGFMDAADVPDLLRRCADQGLNFKENDTTFFLSRETIIASNKPGMAIWREKLFSILSRNAQSATAYFKLPANRVVELGMQIEI